LASWWQKIEGAIVAVKIRLARYGAKKQPTYRVVVADERKKRDGRIVEKLGHYDPRTDPATIVLNEERTKYWLGVGAQPTDALGPILKRAGITDKYVRQRAARKSKAAMAEEAAAKAAAPKAAKPAAAPAAAPTGTPSA
jgi:small subunit ribosomal protein S16